MSEPSVIHYPNKLRERLIGINCKKQMWMWIWLYCRYLISICWTVTGRCALGTGCGFQVLPLRIVFSVQTASLPLCTAWGWIPPGSMSGKERVHFSKLWFVCCDYDESIILIFWCCHCRSRNCNGGIYWNWKRTWPLWFGANGHRIFQNGMWPPTYLFEGNLSWGKLACHNTIK